MTNFGFSLRENAKFQIVQVLCSTLGDLGFVELLLHSVVGRLRDPDTRETHLKAFLSVFEDFVIDLRGTVYSKGVAYCCFLYILYLFIFIMYFMYIYVYLCIFMYI